MTQDVPPIVAELRRINPDVMTVAFDPEASGPDTHYKVMQALAEALRVHLSTCDKPNLRVWGYRNVWFRFDPSEANVFVPVTLAMFSVMHDAFMNSFITQKDASFPSHECDGPFSQLAQRIQVEQYQKVKICLGREWFYNHPNALILRHPRLGLPPRPVARRIPQLLPRAAPVHREPLSRSSRPPTWRGRLTRVR